MESSQKFDSLAQLDLTNNIYQYWPSAVCEENTTASVWHRDPLDLSSNRLIAGVSSPELMVFTPEESNGIGIVVFPGGSYQRLSIDNEGRDIGNTFTKFGYTVFVATYRMPGEGHSYGSETSLADAQRAVRWVRVNREKWNIEQVGILGFSAGGHLAGQLATRFNTTVYDALDNTDTLSAKPDFCGLIYPVVTMDTEFGHKGSAIELLGSDITEETLQRYSIEKCVHAKMAPCFLVHSSDDDSVPVENSIVLWQALRSQQVPVEMHLFNEGGHGFGITKVKDKPAHQWPTLFHKWVSYILKI
ncbi:alpha/beta hydrolase [Vibrio ziniensis]|uniref:Alpha/beta hydrolase n=1 Tax=Vibrio ziniensis TaxID=2711221 RepID=A0A6G7CPY4_9VIBR|nr:alpha/beta hydrolase [Vibrio ziniensis]QIH44106.1 alpha/beta hydrolase [Vibrio ziniensis]QOT69930.1 endo-1-4-beta-xylanase [Vibrio ziniensis]